MKKIFGIVFALALLLTLSACGEKTNGQKVREDIKNFSAINSKGYSVKTTIYQDEITIYDEKVVVEFDKEKNTATKTTNVKEIAYFNLDGQFAENEVISEYTEKDGTLEDFIKLDMDKFALNDDVVESINVLDGKFTFTLKDGVTMTVKDKTCTVKEYFVEYKDDKIVNVGLTYETEKAKTVIDVEITY